MRGDNILARYVKSTKHLPATILLTRITFWSKVKGVGVAHEGVKWIANSRSEWAEETGLSEKQVKDALAVLREHNLVQTTIIAWRKRSALLVRLTQRAEAIAAGVSDPNGTEGQEGPAPNGTGGWDHTGPGVGPVGVQGSGPNGTVLYSKGDTQGETQGDTQGEKGALTHADASLLPETKKDPLPPKAPLPANVNVETVMPTVKEIKAAGVVKKHLHKPDSLQGLSFTWKQMVGEETDTLVVLKAKEAAQLKTLHKLCPPGTAQKVLVYVLGNWIKFVKRTETDDGAKNTPAKPHVGFLLQHVSTAVTMALQSKPPAKKHDAPKAKTFEPAVQLISPKPEEPKLSPEELHQMIWGDQ